MDGGGRNLRSIGALSVPFAPAPFSFANPAGRYAGPSPFRLAPRRRLAQGGLLRLLTGPFVGTGLAVAFLGAVTGYGLVHSGRYADFVAADGSVQDFAARSIGLSIKTISVSGTHALSSGEIIGYAGIKDHHSLLFLDVAAVRARLKSVPLIKEATLTKLFPGRLLIEIEERVPHALWQKDGIVSVIADDGTTLDVVRDPKTAELPLVVGVGANGALPEYLDILDAAGPLRERIRAGMYVAERRWTLKFENGVEVMLPERAPAEAVARFAQIEHDSHVLEKDVTTLDLRQQGRLTAHLTADAAAARDDALAKKTKKKGAAT